MRRRTFSSRLLKGSFIMSIMALLSAAQLDSICMSARVWLDRSSKLTRSQWFRACMTGLAHPHQNGDHLLVRTNAARLVQQASTECLPYVCHGVLYWCMPL